MTERKGWLLAAIAGAVAIASLALGGLRALDQLSDLQNANKRLGALQQLEGDGVIEQAKRQVKEALRKPPTGLRALAEVYLPGVPLEVAAAEPLKLDADWLQVEERASFDALSGEQLGLLMQKLEAQRPPWRMTGLEVEPARDGLLKGSLTCVSLRSSGASP